MAFLDLADLKILLRSTLISSPKPLTVQELQRDFRSSEGVDIPFSAMGFKNILDFLHSLQDTVEVLRDGTLTARRSAETQHLQDLVEKQRIPKKKSSHRRRCSYRPNQSRYSQINCYSQHQFTQQRTSHSRNQSGAWPRSRCQGSNVSMQQERHQQASFSIQQVASFPRQQAASLSRHQVAPFPRQQAASFSRNQGSLYQERRDDTRKYGPPPSSASSNKTDDSFELVSCLQTKDSSGHQSRFPNYNDSKGDNFQSRTDPYHYEAPEPIIAVEKNDATTSIPEKVKNRLMEILREHPYGILCSRLSQLHMEKFNAPLDCRDYGFSNMIELISAVPRILESKKSNGDWVIRDAESSPSVSLEEMEEKVKERILRIARTLESSVSIRKFDELYENAYGVSLSSEVKCFASVDSILASIDSSVVTLCLVDGTWMVRPRRKHRNKENASVEGYPSGVLRPGSKLPRLERFSDAIIPCMEVRLGEIYSPHLFYIIPSHMHSSHSVLDQQLQSFYAVNDELALTDKTVKRGLYCVAPYMDRWHRAIVTDLITSGLVRVYLIDFGTQLSVPTSKLRFLNIQFAVTPKQAIRAKLHDIAPLGKEEMFSKEANRLFFELAADRNLKAYVKGLDFSKETTVSVRLIDMESNEQVSVNERLVTVGVAKLCPKPNQANGCDTNEACTSSCQGESEEQTNVERNNVEIKVETRKSETGIDIAKTRSDRLRSLLSRAALR